jgi:integrase/recombinase XerD
MILVCLDGRGERRVIMSGLGVGGAGGELAVHVPGFRAALAERRYAPRTISTHAGLLRSLGDWLQDEGLPAGELTGGWVAQFLTARRAAGARGAVTPFVMVPLLEYLERLGVVPRAASRLPIVTVATLSNSSER